MERRENITEPENSHREVSSRLERRNNSLVKCGVVLKERIRMLVDQMEICVRSVVDFGLKSAHKPNK